MEAWMRVHQIMTHKVITVKADTAIFEAANLMLQHHISGPPVVDETGELIGIVSEGDFICRSEIGTENSTHQMAGLPDGGREICLGLRP
jgi:CBS-domain-containing membrane protein